MNSIRVRSNDFAQRYARNDKEQDAMPNNNPSTAKAARLAVKALLALAGRQPPTIREQAQMWDVSQSSIVRDGQDLKTVLAELDKLLQRDGWSDLLSTLPTATVDGAAWSTATVTLHRNHETGRVEWKEFTETIHKADGEQIATVQHAASSESE